MTSEGHIQTELFPKIIDDYSQGKDELNIAEFPVALVSRRNDDGALTRVFKDSIRDKSNGETVDRILTINGTETWGLPTAQDDEVLLGLIQLTRLHGWQQSIHFTRMNLVKMLGWAVGGASYKRIYLALHRLSTTTYNYQNSWRDRENQEWIPSKVFSYIQELDIHETNSPTNGGLCMVKWTDWFHQNLVSGNLKSLDFDVYRSLKGSLAKRLYRFLDKRFYHKKVLEFDIKVLTLEKLGLGRSYKDVSQLKRFLDKAVTELESVNFLKKTDKKSRYRKEGKGVWKIIFYAKTLEDEVKHQEQELNFSNEEEGSLETQLVKYGVTRKIAQDLTKSCPETLISEKIEMLEFLCSEDNAHESPSNSGAWLASAIRGDYKPPNDFKTREQIEKEKAEAQAKIDARKAKKKKQAEEEAKKEADLKAKWDVWKKEKETLLEALSDQERENLMTFAHEHAVKNNILRKSEGSFYEAEKQMYIENFLMAEYGLSKEPVKG